ncbi:hypothetical protein O181_035629 [Austropuccinia psidii MF-1]|uniref:OPT superfamily oligopeptide transporter n=1 Tax=Austropuccinia psidii MF-1 TaxID=1389203 RepID=A0A9Q3D343_9BASI|nr:hypothetical protein [Austropuccinia psidii MF-1]
MNEDEHLRIRTSTSSSISSSSSMSSQLKSTQSYESFSFRAIIGGIFIGSILAFINTYFGLQTGWVSMMSLQSSILGFSLFKILPTSRRHPFTISENILLQTTSTAVGSMPLTAGLVGIIPAFAQLDPTLDGSNPILFSPFKLISWSFGLAFFGVFLAIPLRNQVIIKEKLVFPSGTATAHLLALLHNKPISKTDRSLSTPTSDPVRNSPQLFNSSEPSFQQKQWKLFILTFSVSLLHILSSIAFPVLYAIPIFDLFGPLAHDWSWWFTPSLAFVGQGMIMGLHTTYSMMCGAIFGWLFLSPLSVYQGWATHDSVKGWILWPALSIMIIESILSLISVIISLLVTWSSTTDYIQATAEENDVEVAITGRYLSSETLEPYKIISFRSVKVGFVISSLVCVIIMGILFERMKWWATILALVLASIFSLLGVRALGETDLNPVTSIGKISQLIFGFVQPNNLVANLVAGGISEAGAMQAGEIMQDFKTAELHGVDPNQMFYGQMIGSFVSVFVSSGIYALYSNAYKLPSTAFPVPSAAVWLSLARLINQNGLPQGSRPAMIVSGFIFSVIGSLQLLNKTYKRRRPQNRLLQRCLNRISLSWYFPSGIPFATGMINTPSFSIGRFIGGLVAYQIVGPGSKDTDRQKQKKIWLIVVASGFVLGEGIGSIIGLISKIFFNLNPISCWGCDSFGGGYCGGC